MPTIPVLTAIHDKEGVWDFSCPLHDEPWTGRFVSAPRQARKALEGHMDKLHPGVKARIRVSSQFSGTTNKIYTAPTEVKTKDLL